VSQRFVRQGTPLAVPQRPVRQGTASAVPQRLGKRRGFNP
jgi:hypothetical protein